MDNIKYEVMKSFIHFNTHEKMYRVKRTFTSGGLDYVVYNDAELKRIAGIEVK